MLSLFGKKIYNEFKLPGWLSNIIALMSISYSTIGIVFGVFDENPRFLIPLIILTAIFYGIGIKYGLKFKSSFYLSIIPFSLIIIISAVLMKLSDDGSMFFFISLFVVGSVTLIIKNLINLQKNG